MPLIDFTTSQPRPKPLLKRFRVVFAVAVLLGASALGSTLAANINLNDDSNVEFGQGVVQTIACDDQITITPFSTFENAAGAGSFLFTSLEISGIDSSANKCSGKTFVIKAYGDSGQLDLFNYTGPSENTNYNAIEIANEAGAFSWISGGDDGDDVIPGPSGDLTQTSFTLKFTSAPDVTRTALASAEDVTRITVESKDSIQVTPAAYAIGDTGPGGGKIFYVAESPFICGSARTESCTYLEVAPDGWNIGEDPMTTWAPEGIGRTSEITPDMGIGFGYSNSIEIAALPGANSANCAAWLALSYISVSGSVTKNDWFLPSKNELDQLYLHHSEVGSFGTSWYFTSSDYSVDNGGYAWGQRLTDGVAALVGKQTENSFRPIRAF